MLLTVNAAAQRFTVSGYILDAKTGESLISSGIVSGDDRTISDTEGRYSISLPAGENTIHFSFIGYESQSLSLNLQSDTLVNVHLSASLILNASKVTAYNDTSFQSTQMGAMEVPVDALLRAPVVIGEQDVLKTVQLMPGIQQGVEGFSSLFVRGGGADENMYLLDGVPLYNVSHLLGLFSAFTPEAIKKITLYKGAFPAHYGGRISGVVDIRAKDGNVNDVHGSAGIGLLSSKLHLEGPVFNQKTTFSISGRLMHTGLVTPLLKSSLVGVHYAFYDVTGKITHRFSPNDRLSLSAYIGNDNFFWNRTDYQKMDWGNAMMALRWSHVFDGKWSMNAQISYNRFGASSEFHQTSEKVVPTPDGPPEAIKEEYLSTFSSLIRDGAVGIDVDGHLSPKQSIKSGVSVIYHYFVPSTNYSVKENSKTTVDGIGSRSNYVGWEAALYVEDELKVTPAWSIHPGVRYVLMTAGAKPYHSIQPRFSTRYAFPIGLSLKAGYARMGQYVHQLSSYTISMPSDIWVPISGDIRPVTSDIVSLGAYYDGLHGWEFSLETYGKYTQNILEYRDGASMYGSAAGWEKLVEMGISRSLGLELFAKKTAGSLTGWLSYTLSKTEHCFPNAYINNGKWFPAKYDRRHIIHLLADWKISKAVSISASWSLMSGSYITLPERTTFYLDVSEGINNGIYPPRLGSISNYYSSRNNYHLPPSHTLNISVHLQKKKRHGQNIWVFGVYNAYNAMNPNIVYMQTRAQDGENTGETISVKKVTVLPILPSVSYTFKF